MKIYKSVGKYVTLLHWHCQGYFDKRLAPYKIGPGQLPILMNLYKLEHVTQEYIARELKIDKTTVARSIKKLETEGYIIRMSDPEDKRSYSITLTGKARELKDEFVTITREWTAHVLEGMSPDEQEQFFYLLAKASENAEHAMKDL